MTDGGVVVMKLGNAGGAKAPCSDANVQSRKSPGIGASLPTPLDSVRTLQSRLRAKAKSEAAYRFYSLWDKVCREDVLYEAYRLSLIHIWMRRCDTAPSAGASRR